MIERLNQLLTAIQAPDAALAGPAQECLDNPHQTKPRGALGSLEEIVRDLCAMRAAVWTWRSPGRR